MPTPSYIPCVAKIHGAQGKGANSKGGRRRELAVSAQKRLWFWSWIHGGGFGCDTIMRSRVVEGAIGPGLQLTTARWGKKLMILEVAQWSVDRETHEKGRTPLIYIFPFHVAKPASYPFPDLPPFPPFPPYRSYGS